MEGKRKRKGRREKWMGGSAKGGRRKGRGRIRVENGREGRGKVGKGGPRHR